MHCSPALYYEQISRYLTWILPPIMSPHLRSGNLTCLCFLTFASAFSLSACILPGLPLQRVLPHSELRLGLCSLTRLHDCHLFGLLNIVNKVLNCADLNVCCSWIRIQILYKDTCHLIISRCSTWFFFLSNLVCKVSSIEWNFNYMVLNLAQISRLESVYRRLVGR